MLISPEYAAQQQYLHEHTLYGTASKKYAPLVTQIIDRLELDHVLDYGCGAKMNLMRAMTPRRPVRYQGYDPGVPDLADAPIPAQMLACIDVLEHIEPEYLDNVLDHIASLTEAVAFITIHTGPAMKVLPDGRNAHLIQQPMQWWLPKLWDRLDLHTMQVTGEHAFYVIGYARAGQIEKPNGSKASEPPRIELAL